ncbi:unnamed protein product [Miscanthus lutarioriparius]|uniref:Uncharacterized protein n=1 Tax=Miscanthus lutarioriparius TaxID=422564 RepID=A0A811QPY5_9POAL|nr:unnamed protein product [Miscanthus lutarioriparius]
MLLRPIHPLRLVSSAQLITCAAASAALLVRERLVSLSTSIHGDTGGERAGVLRQRASASAAPDPAQEKDAAAAAGNAHVVLLKPNSSPPKKPSRADTDERWGARKDAGSNPLFKPGRADAVARVGQEWKSGRPRAAERWDSDKKTSATSSSVSNDMELDTPWRQLLPRALYAGLGFIAAPKPSMLPMPSSLMVRAA